MNKTEQTEQNETKIWKRIAPLLHLLPAVLAVALVVTTLPVTRPALAAVPERLEMEETAKEAEKKEEESSDEAEELAAVDADYEDGVHVGSAQGYGGLVTVQVTVEGGKITAVDILSAPGETASFFNRAKGVIQSVLARQTWEVDVVSGATYSSRGILGAIQNALTGAKVENEEPEQETAVASLSSDAFAEPTGGYQDGTYYGSATGFGGTIKVKVVISGGKIASISIVSASGETGSYLSRAKAVIQRILAANSPNVDTVSGATYSSNGIINAVKRALAQASGSSASNLAVESKPATTSTNKVKPADKPSVAYKDGVYTGTGEGFGGDITVQVTIKKGKIASVKILSAEDETPAYLKRASALLSMITTAQSTNVDVISGATYSSNGILEATNAALAKAVDKGSGETNTKPEKPPVVEQPNNPSTEPDGPQEEVVYTDGSYTATAMCTDDDLFSYQVQVAITVADGKITNVGVEKLEDTSDEPEMNDTYLNYAINGRTRKNVWYEGVVNQILTKQSADAIDIVSSATYSSEAITAAAKEALQGAKAGETVDPGKEEPDDGSNEGDIGEEPGGEENPGEETPEEPKEDEPDDVQDGPVYADGSYTAVALCTDEDMFCYQVQIEVAVTDGKITNVTVAKIEDTSEDPDANDTYLDYAINGRTRKNVWYEGVVNQIFAKQSADEIDVVSGATYSSNAITTAAQEALQYAKVEAGT